MRFKRYRVLVITLVAVLCGYHLVIQFGYDYGQKTQGSSKGMRDELIYSETVKDRIRDICGYVPPEKYSDWTRSPNYLVVPSKKLSYCTMYYDMDDIWTRIFEIFQDSKRINDYSKKPFPSLKEKEPANFEAPARKESETLLYVRNPYVNLYMAYHDRYHLLYSTQSKTCEFLTFQEFLDKVITHVKLRQGWGTSWASPLIPKCRLCDINVYSIVREENFAQDMLDLSQKLSQSRSEITAALEFIQRPTVFIQSVVLAKLKFLNPVCTYNKIGPMLWRSLQCMGVVNNSVEYPQSLTAVDVTFHPDILVKAALDSSKFPMTETEKLAQKQTILAEVYRDIKEETIIYIQEIYKYEFKIFGYSDQRPERQFQENS